MKYACLLLLPTIAYSSLGTPSYAAGKCTSIQAQCAVEIGGTCDPATGRWRYGAFQGHQYGGTNHGGAFDACVSRKLGQGR